MGGRRANAVVGAAALVVAIALVVLAVSLHATQAAARETLISRFEDRAQVVSALIQAEVSSVPSSAAATPAYTSATVNGQALDRAATQSHLAFAMILDRAGTVIAHSRTMSAADLSQALRSPAFARVRTGAPVSLSDVQSGGTGATAVVDLIVPLQTAAGRRILVGGLPAPVLGALFGTYLQRIPHSVGAAYVLDSRGAMIADAAPASAPPGASVTQLPLTGLNHRHSGPYGHGGYFVSATIPGSTWRVVLTTTQSSLFSSVSGARKWLPWAIYIAFGLVALGVLVLLRRLLASGTALSRANAELATSNARLQSTNELLRHAAELSRSNAELEQFASIASHDLQEPLRKVQTFAAQLNAKESENLSEQGQDFLRRMSDAAGRMRSLIDDLLMFSRVSTQGHPFTAVNLGHVISQVLVDLEVSIEESRALMTVGLMPTIEADPLQMRQLFQNLLGNALKFRRPEVTPELRVEAQVIDHIAQVTVRDNGIGFDEQYATRIFRAFERLHGARAYPGTGIGLALCRKIVERHHGTITATSEIDHGATFTIRLPVAQPEEGPSLTSLFPETTPQDEMAGAHA
ncbi:MAG TPA: ATP-binding protein [Solirubrobacteraceae bacterium]|nr:ATP-binding protein [Solirubrobacteraceae bacterium]